jgi:hypothetical protein
MTSAANARANRSNAAKSTGPKTARGKAWASRNALRHGLATITAHDPLVSSQIERMAKAICGDRASPVQYEQAPRHRREHRPAAECSRRPRSRYRAREKRLRRPQARQSSDSRPTTNGSMGSMVLPAASARADKITHPRCRRRMFTSKIVTANRKTKRRKPAVISRKPPLRKGIKDRSPIAAQNEIEPSSEVLAEIIGLERYLQRVHSRLRQAVRKYMANTIVAAPQVNINDDT